MGGRSIHGGIDSPVELLEVRKLHKGDCVYDIREQHLKNLLVIDEGDNSDDESKEEPLSNDMEKTLGLVVITSETKFFATKKKKSQKTWHFY